MAFNFTRLQKVANSMISRWGAQCSLRRTVGGVIQDRPCICAIAQFHPLEHRGQMLDTTDRLAFVSPIGVTIAPDKELDSLITYIPGTSPPQVDEILKITKNGKIAPAGVVVYWELEVRA